MQTILSEQMKISEEKKGALYHQYGWNCHKMICYMLHLGQTKERKPAGLVESRRIAQQRLAIRDSVKMSSSAIRWYGNWVIPRIRGRAQRRSYSAQATLHYPKQTSWARLHRWQLPPFCCSSKHKQVRQLFQGWACCRFSWQVSHENAEMSWERTRIPTIANSGCQGFTYILFHASGGIFAALVHTVSFWRTPAFALSHNSNLVGP